LIKIEGLDVFAAKVNDLVKATDNKHVGEIIIKQAEVIRDRIQQKAPQGPTGNLKRSPIAKLMPNKSNYPVIAIAGIDRKIAPHAGLVEFGTSRAPAHPFFRPAVDECSGKVMDGIKDDLKKNIEKAV
jgi:HK97 gp10 family phage protein